MKTATASERRLDEEDLLGSFLFAPEGLEIVRHTLKPSHFEDPHLGELFGVMLRAESLTPQSVLAVLTQRNIPAPIGMGWGSYLSDLQDKGGKGLSPDAVLAHMRAIMRRSLDRRWRELLLRAGAAASNGSDPEQAVASFAREAAEIELEAQARAKQPLCIVSGDGLLELRIPARSYILKPIFREKDLAMVYAARGIGKSWVAEGIAAAIASGGRFLEWTAETARRVLLVDGELPLETIQERLRINREAYDHGSLENLRILARDIQDPGQMPNLSDPKGQEKLETHLDGIAVVILDNVSTLFHGGIENEAESWECAQEFLLRLRQRGIMAAYVHHAGRSGNPRGTSKREDILDTILELKHPKDYSPTQGARFELHYAKSRGAYGADVSPIEATLHQDPTGWTWTVRSIEDATFEKVVSLISDGLSQKEIGQEVGKSKGYISKLASRARREGRVQ